jgi:periplasmic mercuric ion binding protein
MKKIRFILLTVVMVMFISSSYAQDVKTEEIKIKVTFHCANGKAMIEKELVKEDGVSSVIADLETKVVTIKYDPSKQNKEKLVAAIEKIGYETEYSKKDTNIKKSCTHDQQQNK